MQNISKERTTHETEYSDESIRGRRGGTQFKISTELNINKPKQPKKSNSGYARYPSRPYLTKPPYANFVPRPIQSLQTYQYPYSNYQYPYYSYTNPHQTNSMLSYPYNYYNTQYSDREYPIEEPIYSDDEYSDEDESFFSKFADKECTSFKAIYCTLQSHSYTFIYFCCFTKDLRIICFFAVQFDDDFVDVVDLDADVDFAFDFEPSYLDECEADLNY
ncbi:hypothetical protein BpHYR1_016796 [Brachionus plicatilis]|uniref:Uncharacterized protein n=1 Tax=Brachionus plicatilis TaxID=10195 RepID=A0A3M7RL86_BRAPC|nr:hypothetical protein BpHYR1_016796 [Brachionus plicatilis]